MNEQPTVEHPPTETSATATGATASPIITKRKKKRKYSRGLRGVQELERGVSRATTRVARAVAKGMATYRKRAAKSARKKRDGAIRDFAVNLAEGVGQTMRTLSPVPADLVRALHTKRARRRVRRAVRSTARMLRPLG